ncbi:MAG TPA: hypothetical protein VFR33_10460 [Candidatus Dormibacteraeota bacterium]|nr:hypothetical protein [Candidatus Dormibacteraeota bacterium]
MVALLEVLLIAFWASATLASMISIQWPSQPPPPPNPAFLPLTSWLVINVVALVVFVTRYRGWGYWVMVIVQAINVVAVYAVMVALRLEDLGFASLVVAASICALVALLMLLAGRYTNAPGSGTR